jgi:hypothetical protein
MVENEKIMDFLNLGSTPQREAVQSRGKQQGGFRQLRN